jgi:hypothetical protein
MSSRSAFTMDLLKRLRMTAPLSLPFIVVIFTHLPVKRFSRTIIPNPIPLLSVFITFNPFPTLQNKHSTELLK